MDGTVALRVGSTIESAAYYGATVARSVVAFICIWMIAEIHSPRDVASLVVLMGALAYVPLLDLGFFAVAKTRIAAGRVNRIAISNAGALAISAFLAVAAALFGWVALDVAASDGLHGGPLAFGLVVVLVFLSYACDAELQGAGYHLHSRVADLCGGLGALILVYWFGESRSSLSGLLLLIYGPYGGSKLVALMLFRRFRRNMRAARWSWSWLVLLRALPFVPTQISAAALSAVPLFLVARTDSDAAAAWAAIALRLAMAVVAVQAAVMPLHWIRLAGASRTPEFIRILTRFVTRGALLGVFLGALVGVLGPHLFWFFGADYVAAGSGLGMFFLGLHVASYCVVNTASTVLNARSFFGVQTLVFAFGVAVTWLGASVASTRWAGTESILAAAALGSILTAMLLCVALRGTRAE
jgi:hypothetical protein